MLIEIHENIAKGKVINQDLMNLLSDTLSKIQNQLQVNVTISSDLYYGLSFSEAEKALDCAIQDHDVYVTKEEYQKMLDELTSDIHNQDQGFEELTNVANDMAIDILRIYKKID